MQTFCDVTQANSHADRLAVSPDHRHVVLDRDLEAIGIPTRTQRNLHLSGGGAHAMFDRVFDQRLEDKARNQRLMDIRSF